MTNAAIDCQKLSKRYVGSQVYALKDLTIQVQPGEVYGFLGANGAGKSTTIRTLLGFLLPTSGQASICGLDIVADTVATKAHIGYLAGDVALYQRSNGQDLMSFLQSLQPLKHPDYFQKLVKQFEAELDKPISTLSKGNRQKLGLIQALMHEPEVLILDEPTAGLDPLMQEVFYDTLRQASRNGTAILMSSHNLAEAQRVCGRVGIIKHGQLIHEQTIDDKTELSKPVFRVRLAKAAQLSQLKKTKGLRLMSETSDHSLLLQASDSLPAALAALSKFEVTEFSTVPLNLEDEFLEFYGDGA